MLFSRPLRGWIRLRYKRLKWATISVSIFALVVYVHYTNSGKNSPGLEAGRSQDANFADQGVAWNLGQDTDQDELVGPPPYDSEKHQPPPESKILTSGQECPGLEIRLAAAKANLFRVVDGIKTYLYSAYLESDRVRIIAVRQTSDPRSLFCHLWYDVTDTDPLSVVQAKIDHIPESHGERHAAAYIVCKLPKERRDRVPLAVNVALTKCHSVSNGGLPVQRSGVNDPTLSFTVCVTPLNNNYNRVHELVEMIEFNRLLGADRIAFYNYSIGPVVDQVLHYYKRRGVVEIVPWNLPTRQIHYYGQLASLNDCLHRHRHKSKYLVYQDLDEFIIPQGSLTNWDELIEQRLKARPSAITFQVKNVFFRREWPKLLADFPFNEKVKKYKSVVLQTTVKEFQVLPYNHRSKYILDPLKVSTVGVHSVWEPTGLVDRIPQQAALVCHYRNWQTPNDRQKRLDDFSVVKRFGQGIVARLDRAWIALERNLGLNPEAVG